MLFNNLFSQNLLAANSGSSTEKYIEVQVTDTMMVAPDRVTLMVKIDEGDQEESIFDENYDDKKNKKTKPTETNNSKTSKDKAEAVFKKYNLTEYTFHEKSVGKNPFDKEFSIYENAYEVQVSNPAILDNLMKDLNNIENTESLVTDSQLADKHSHELILIEKLMQKAEREAKAIAKTMNVTLGKPLNVSNQSMNNTYSSMFNNMENMGGLGAMFNMLGNMFKPKNGETKVTISKSLVVRFSYQ